MAIFVRKNWAVIVFFVFLAIFRFSLIGKGHCFDADERRYFYALWFWNDIFHGKFFNGFSCIFEVQARPGFVLISLFPALFQIILLHLHFITTANLHFFDIPCVFNVLVSLANSAAVYCILRFIVTDGYLVLAGTMVYSLLVNSNVYLRHLFPYDYSLLFFLIAILLILKQRSADNPSSGFALGAGILCAMGSLVYPGYYSLALIVVLFLAMATRWNLRILAWYVGGFLALILCFEFFSELLRKSYLMECAVLSDTVKHGSFAEGFLFIFRYLKEVEGLIGMVLFALLVLYVIGFLVKDRRPCQWLLIGALLMYSIHAVLGFVFFKMVFYGRSLHMYFPFVAIAAIRLLSLMPRPNYRKGMAVILVVISLISFIPWARAYKELSYPYDLYFKYLSDVPQNKEAVTVNLKSYLNVKEGNDPQAPAHLILVADRPHPLNFASYTFENYGPQERKIIRERKYHMKIYLDPQAQNLRESGKQEPSLGDFLYHVVKLSS